MKKIEFYILFVSLSFLFASMDLSDFSSFILGFGSCPAPVRAVRAPGTACAPWLLSVGLECLGLTGQISSFS
jgi:hypothetical protein